jgi:hypothetical protein
VFARGVLDYATLMFLLYQIGRIQRPKLLGYIVRSSCCVRIIHCHALLALLARSSSCRSKSRAA